MPLPPHLARSPREPFSADTTPEAQARQFEIWGRMSPREKLQLVEDMRETVLELARAGIRQRHPGISERECFLRLAVLTLGHDLARRAYPEITALNITKP